MKFVWGNSQNPEANHRLLGWCEAKLGYPLSTPCSTLGIFDERDDLIAVVVFHDFSRRCGAIQMSAASTTPRWLTRQVLWEMFSFVFLGLKCQVAVLRVSALNERMLKILPRYGFTAYRLPRLRGRHEDEIINILTIEDWQANGFHKG